MLRAFILNDFSYQLLHLASGEEEHCFVSTMFQRSPKRLQFKYRLDDWLNKELIDQPLYKRVVLRLVLIQHNPC